MQIIRELPITVGATPLGAKVKTAAERALAGSGHVHTVLTADSTYSPSLGWLNRANLSRATPVNASKPTLLGTPSSGWAPGLSVIKFGADGSTAGVLSLAGAVWPLGSYGWAFTYKPATGDAGVIVGNTLAAASATYIVSQTSGGNFNLTIRHRGSPIAGTSYVSGASPLMGICGYTSGGAASIYLLPKGGSAVTSTISTATTNDEESVYIGGLAGFSSTLGGGELGAIIGLDTNPLAAGNEDLLSSLQTYLATKY